MVPTGFMVIYCGLGRAPPLFSTEAISFAIVCTRTSSLGGGGVNPPEGGSGDADGGGDESDGDSEGSTGDGGFGGVNCGGGGVRGRGGVVGGTLGFILFCCGFNGSIIKG